MALVRRHGGKGSVLALSTFAANILGYLFFLVVNRTQRPGDVGVVTAITNLVTVCGVPALAIQLVAARRASPAIAQPSAVGQTDTAAQALRTGATIGLGVGTVIVMATWPLMWALRLGSPLTILLLAATMVPTCVTFAVQGLLHGVERFALLGVLYATSAGSRFLAGELAGALGFRATGVIGLSAIGALLTSCGALLLVRQAIRPALSRSTRPWLRPTLAGMTSTSALLVVSNLDTPLARQFLSESDAGRFAVVSLVSKAAFWGPAFIVTLFFPAMARNASRHHVVAALALTGGLAAVGTLLSWILAKPIVSVLGGGAYDDLAPLIPLFTAVGAAWSVSQVVLYWGLARGQHGFSWAAWGVAALVVGAVATVGHSSIAAVERTILFGALTLLVLGALYVARTPVRST